MQYCIISVLGLVLWYTQYTNTVSATVLFCHFGSCFNFIDPRFQVCIFFFKFSVLSVTDLIFSEYPRRTPSTIALTEFVNSPRISSLNVVFRTPDICWMSHSRRVVLTLDSGSPPAAPSSPEESQLG